MQVSIERIIQTLLIYLELITFYFFLFTDVLVTVHLSEPFLKVCFLG